jgi:hypothetical protein
MSATKLIFCYLVPFILVFVLYVFFGGVFYLGIIFLVLGFFQPCAGVIRVYELLKSKKVVPKALRNYFVMTTLYITVLGVLSFLVFDLFSSHFFFKVYMAYLSLAVLIASYYLCEVVYAPSEPKRCQL